MRVLDGGKDTKDELEKKIALVVSNCVEYTDVYEGVYVPRVDRGIGERA